MYVTTVVQFPEWLNRVVIAGQRGTWQNVHKSKYCSRQRKRSLLIINLSTTNVCIQRNHSGYATQELGYSKESFRLCHTGARV